MIGHLVAAVGTIPWLLQFVEDEKVSQQAAQDVVWCSTFLSRMAGTWPHISHKVRRCPTLSWKEKSLEKLGEANSKIS